MSKATFVAVGKLSKEPKMQYTPDGAAMTHLSFPIHSGFGDKQKTTWVSATTFGKMAEACNQYLEKGRRVLVSGEITEISTFQKQDESIGAELRVRAYDVTFLDSASKSDSEPEEF